MEKANQPNTEELSRETATRKGRLDRRTLLRAGALAAGMAGMGAGIARAAETIGADAPDWMKTPGRSLSAYGMPSKYQEKVQRAFAILPGRPGTGASRTPLQLLEEAQSHPMGTAFPNATITAFLTSIRATSRIGDSRARQAAARAFPWKRLCAIRWNRKSGFSNAPAMKWLLQSAGAAANHGRRAERSSFLFRVDGRAVGGTSQRSGSSPRG